MKRKKNLIRHTICYRNMSLIFFAFRALSNITFTLYFVSPIFRNHRGEREKGIERERMPSPINSNEKKSRMTENTERERKKEQQQHISYCDIHPSYSFIDRNK